MKWVRTIFLPLFIGCALFIGFVTYSLQPHRTSSADLTSLAFVSYTPSAWEEEWWERADEWRDRECEVLATAPHATLVQQWLDVSRFSILARGASVPRPSATDAFSVMRYRTPAGAVVDVRVEPLAGILRDPRLPCAMDLGATSWTPHSSDIQSKDFIYLDPLLFDVTAALSFPRRRVMLFDLGASTFSDPDMPGLSWIYPKYASEGLQLTDLFAWEIRPNPGGTFFEGMPLPLAAATHFFNFGVNMTEGVATNPLAILKSVARKSDYVILKVDIDVLHIEEAVVEALLADPDALALVDDFYWEHHVRIKSMLGWWLSAIDSKEGVKKTMRYLRMLRSRGVRAHAWP
jgi:hypothetical protein